MKVDGAESHTRRRRTRAGMSVSQAFVTLGLPFGSEPSVVHARYRQLALRYHPDRNAGDAYCLQRFKELSAAYRLIERKTRFENMQPEQVHDECERCGEFAPVHKGLDGSLCCADCLSTANRRPLLPAPPITIVTCATTIVLLAMSTGAMIAGWLSHGRVYLIAALLLAVMSLVSLAITCATVIYTADPRSPAQQRCVRTVSSRSRGRSPQFADSCL